MINRIVLSLVIGIASTLAASGSQWQRDPRSLLTNFNNMYNPCVVETGGLYRYRMWFFGWAADATNTGTPGPEE